MKVDEKKLKSVFTDAVCNDLFPKNRSNQFFEALFGDIDEGAYDIELSFQGCRPDYLEFCFKLKRKPGKCLACNLTYGLPQVFMRHPAIDIKNLVAKIDTVLGKNASISKWRLGQTKEISKDLHMIPLLVYLQAVSA